jgi:hypothetical protein
MVDAKMSRYLQKVPLFAGLPEAIVVELGAAVAPRCLAKDDILIRQGQRAEALYVVRFGWLQLTSRNAQGGDDVVAQLGPNELIGELSLLLPQACPATVTALSPVELLELRRAAFEDVAERQPSLALAVACSLAARTEAHLALLQKAAQWSQALAAGEWRTVLIDLELLQAAGDTRGCGSALDEELATAFFDLAQRLRALSVAAEVRAATTAVHQFSIEIDEARRQEEVEKLAQRTFFGRLKSATVQFRRQREDGSQSSDGDKG